MHLCAYPLRRNVYMYSKRPRPCSEAMQSESKGYIKQLRINKIKIGVAQPYKYRITAQNLGQPS